MSNIIEPRVLFSPDTEGLPKSTQRHKFFSVGGDTSGGNISRIRIDNMYNSILCTDESYLNFTAEVTARTKAAATTTAFYLSPNAAQNCIKKIEIITNGASICVCDNYNSVASVLNIANVGTNSSGLRGLTEGGGILATYNAPDFVNILTPPNNGIENYLGGTDVSLMYGTPVVQTDTTKVALKDMSFSLPILGLMSSCLKHLPLSYLSASLEIQITWEQDIRKVITSTGELQGTSTCIFKDINFDARVNIYDEASMQVINERNGYRSSGDPIVWTGRQYKASLIDTTIAVQNGTSHQDTLVPNSRYRCLDSVVQGAFPVANGLSTWLPYLGANDYQLRVGSELYPRQKIQSLCEAVMNTQACFSGTSQSLSNTQMDSNATILNQRQPADGRPSKTLNELQPRGVVGIAVGTFDAGGEHNISGIDTTNLTVSSLQGHKAGSITATLPQHQCLVSSITVAYQIDPSDGRMACSF